MKTKDYTVNDLLPGTAWLLTLMGGVLLFVLLYGVALCTLLIPSLLQQIIIFLLSSAAILAAFAVWRKSPKVAQARGTEYYDSEEAPNDEATIHQRYVEFVEGPGGLKENALVFALAWSLIILIFSTLTIILSLLDAYVIGTVSFNWAYLLRGFTYCLLVACAEEIIFRGIIFRILDERYGTSIALLVSAIAFGLCHAFPQGATLSLTTALGLLATAILGSMLCAGYKYTHTLTFPITLHWAWIFIEGNIFGYPVSGKTTESIITPILKAPSWLTSGDFGPEASLLTLLPVLLLTIAFLRNSER